MFCQWGYWSFFYPLSTPSCLSSILWTFHWPQLFYHLLLHMQAELVTRLPICRITDKQTNQLLTSIPGRKIHYTTLDQWSVSFTAVEGTTQLTGSVVRWRCWLSSKWQTDILELSPGSVFSTYAELLRWLCWPLSSEDILIYRNFNSRCPLETYHLPYVRGLLTGGGWSLRRIRCWSHRSQWKREKWVPFANIRAWKKDGVNRE